MPLLDIHLTEEHYKPMQQRTIQVEQSNFLNPYIQLTFS